MAPQINPGHGSFGPQLGPKKNQKSRAIRAEAARKFFGSTDTKKHAGGTQPPFEQGTVRTKIIRKKLGKHNTRFDYLCIFLMQGLNSNAYTRQTGAMKSKHIHSCGLRCQTRCRELKKWTPLRRNAIFYSILVCGFWCQTRCRELQKIYPS